MAANDALAGQTAYGGHSDFGGVLDQRAGFGQRRAPAARTTLAAGRVSHRDLRDLAPHFRRQSETFAGVAAQIDPSTPAEYTRSNSRSSMLYSCSVTV